MANAFACTDFDRLKEAAQLAAPREHRGFFEQRHANSVVASQGGEAAQNFLPGCGGLMGDKKAPQIFNRAFWMDVKSWLETA